MPSRKKLQGKLRKAKQATTKNACDHFGNDRSYSKTDVNAANELATEFVTNYMSKYNALGRGESDGRDVEMVYNVYDRYRQFSDSGKDLFRVIVLSNGTSACLHVADQIDLTKEHYMYDPLPYAMSLIMLAIEIRDKYEGDLNDNIVGEIRRSLDDMTECPREIVKFFHRRNSCNCLKELYYKLKESTPRTAECWHCQKVVDIRKLSRCESCQVAQFCSYDCAVAHWPQHREKCKKYQKNPYQPRQTNSSG